MSGSQDKNETQNQGGLPPELARELASGLQATTVLAQALLTESKEHAATVEQFRSSLEQLGKDVVSLLKIVRDGTGSKQPLTERVSSLETGHDHCQESVQEDIAELKSDLGKVREEEVRVRAASTSGRWTVRAAIVQAIAALVASGIGAWITLLATKGGP